MAEFANEAGIQKAPGIMHINDGHTLSVDWRQWREGQRAGVRFAVRQKNLQALGVVNIVRIEDADVTPFGK